MSTCSIRLCRLRSTRVPSPWRIWASRRLALTACGQEGVSLFGGVALPGDEEQDEGQGQSDQQDRYKDSFIHALPPF